MNPTEALVPIAMFAMIFGCVYVGVSSKHRQRMAMIEKGSLPTPDEIKRQGHTVFAVALLALALGLGIAIGWAVDEQFFPERGGEPAPYFISILICCGAALVYFHTWRERKWGSAK